MLSQCVCKSVMEPLMVSKNSSSFVFVAPSLPVSYPSYYRY